HRSLLIKPEEILHSVAAKLSRTKKIGVMMPDKSQLERIKILWRKYGIEAVAVGVSPYEPVENLSMELEKLKDEDIDLIFMECFGYTLEMKEEVRRITKKPVILTKTLIFKIIHELFK
ncbi:MAG: AroM family protein, partial [Tissierellia bacterium]|nr:AroM family protein [Tissierellia bacterium]